MTKLLCYAVPYYGGLYGKSYSASVLLLVTAFFLRSEPPAVGTDRMLYVTVISLEAPWHMSWSFIGCG